MKISKRIFLCAILSFFTLLHASCALAADEELVYLKVENAVASSFDETPDWAPKPNAMAPVDGNIETRWSSSYKDGQWIYFDFGKPKTMSKILIKWEQAYAASFEILTSDDAVNWKRLVLLENQTGGI